MRDNRHDDERDKQRGSAMVLAIFVLVLLTSMGTALLFLSETEQKMSQANLRTKKAFYYAEAGLEATREALYAVNRNGDFSDDLSDGAGGGAAGPDNLLDFDAGALVPSWNSDGTFGGFSGYDDDVPIRPLAAVADGWYAAWIVNDPLEGGGELDVSDTNNRLLVTSAGAGRDRSYEVVQAIIEKIDILPTVPPATITLLGPAPVFDGGKSTVKRYVGDDCDGAGGGFYVPIVGAVGTDAEDSAEDGIYSNPNYESGGLPPEDTFADLTDPTEPTVDAAGFGTLDAAWQDCEAIRDLIENVRLMADYTCCLEATVCNPVTSCSTPAMSNNHIWFVDGDLDIGPSAPDGFGTLLVTGELLFNGNAEWNGLVMILGRGAFVRYGGGNGRISGGTIAANIAGADGVYGTADDCTGADNGFDPVSYDESGGGNSSTVYCSTDLAAADPVRPYEIVEFLQW